MFAFELIGALGHLNFQQKWGIFATLGEHIFYSIYHWYKYNWYDIFLIDDFMTTISMQGNFQTMGHLLRLAPLKFQIFSSNRFGKQSSRNKGFPPCHILKLVTWEVLYILNNMFLTIFVQTRFTFTIWWKISIRSLISTKNMHVFCCQRKSLFRNIRASHEREFLKWW